MQPTVIIIHPIYIYDIQELFNTVKRFLFVFKDIHTYIQQGNITLIKVIDKKDFCFKSILNFISLKMSCFLDWNNILHY